QEDDDDLSAELITEEYDEDDDSEEENEVLDEEEGSGEKRMVRGSLGSGVRGTGLREGERGGGDAFEMEVEGEGKVEGGYVDVSFGGGETTRAMAAFEESEEACVDRVKALWRDKVLLPPPKARLRSVIEGVQEDMKALISCAPLAADMGGGFKGAGCGGGRGGGRGGGSSPGDTLYRMLLAEMQGDGAVGGLNNRWIDRDASLQLRGAAMLAHHPKFLRHTANLPSKVSRGVRVVAPEATHSMQATLARALSHNTGSRLVLLDDKVLESLRSTAKMEGIPREQLTSGKLVSALLDLAEEDGQPFVIFLRNKGSAVLRSQVACKRVELELDSRSSRVLFLLSTAIDPSMQGASGGGAGGGPDGGDSWRDA
ncbi:unnamed protein product, partial [Discosporangium mesarthrocarpum]